jgi:hypothetical protein
MKANQIILVCSTLIAIGAVTLVLSTVYDSSILGFIGLGLLFWGIIFTYIRTEEYAKKAVMDATISSQQLCLDQIIQKLGYRGIAVHLPPKYLTDSATSRVYVPKQKSAIIIPTPEQIKEQESQFFIEHPPGILLTPPSSELTKLFEKTLETNFARVDVKYLQQNMRKLFVEELEIAQNFEMELENNRIRVKIENSIFTLNRDTAEPFTLGSILGSAIACALAKTAGKPIIIEKQQIGEKGNDMTIEYRALEEEE